jgi:hypothetical protein
VELVVVPVDDVTMEVDLAAVRKAVNPNVIMVCATPLEPCTFPLSVRSRSLTTLCACRVRVVMCRVCGILHRSWDRRLAIRTV